MSPTPPLTTPPRASIDPASQTAAGDGVTLNVENARGARRTGAIWILVISLTLAIVVVGGYWLFQAPRMQAVNHPSGRDLNTQDVRKLYSASGTAAAQNSTGAN